MTAAPTITAVKLRTAAGEDDSVTLPQALVDRLGMQPGEEVQLVEQDGGLSIRRKRVKVADGEIEARANYDGIDMSKVRKEVMDIARRVMREDRDVLRRLAE